MRKEKITRTEEQIDEIKNFIITHGFRNMSEFGKAVGMERQNVWQRVHGKRNPEIQMLLKWASILKCDISELIRLFYPEEYNMYRGIISLDMNDVMNWIDMNLEGKILVLKNEYFKKEYRDAKYQLVIATGGFGCSPNSLGNAIFVRECHNDNPETYRIERCNNDILGVATEKAIEKWKNIYGEFNVEVLKMLGGK